MVSERQKQRRKVKATLQKQKKKLKRMHSNGDVSNAESTVNHAEQNGHISPPAKRHKLENGFASSSPSERCSPDHVKEEIIVNDSPLKSTTNDNSKSNSSPTTLVQRKGGLPISNNCAAKRLKLENGFASNNHNEHNKPDDAHEENIVNGIPANNTTNCKDNNEMNSPHAKLVQSKRGLPIFKNRDGLLKLLRNNETIIITGETGSGKTTQIPQYILEEGLSQDGMICITQPRRVAALSIAKRVAEETNTRLGCTVGYSVRFEDCCSPKTKIKFATDGMIIREALRDSLMLSYEWIILDEAHERSINTDVLFGIVKQAQHQRKLQSKKPLHVIIMSATMDIDKFSKYFNDAMVAIVEGREYPVMTKFLTEQNSDYFLESLSVAWKINKESSVDGDILVFLTGQEEINKAVSVMQHVSRRPENAIYPTLKVLPLYSGLSTQMQNKIFDFTEHNERKLIISTNIAETSITIPGVKYVVDCGRAKIREFDSRSGIERLQVRKISQDHSLQRLGRAGRNGPGVCYHAFTEKEFDEMKEHSTPEILRLNLSSVVLQLLGIGIGDVLKFDFIDRPAEQSITAAYTKLKLLEAIKMKDNIPTLTDLGKNMITFPLDPVYSKVLLSSHKFGCTDEILSIISVLSSESIFSNPSSKLHTANAVRSKFTSLEGDHITFLNIFNAFIMANKSMSWCKKNFLSHRSLYYAAEIKKQLKGLCKKLDLEIVSCKENTDEILKCLLTGLYMNIAETREGRRYRSMDRRSDVYIHPSSSLFNKNCTHVMYSQITVTSKSYVKINSKINIKWVEELFPEYYIKKGFSLRV